MDLITTYSGVKINPVAPTTDDIKIGDIAHALSYMTRANGHCKHFYSVAQHSINCALEARARNYPPKLQLACLLHDGSEAYLADIIRPCKKHLPVYLELEGVLQDVIFETFSIYELDPTEHKLVFSIDDIMLYHEFEHTMKINTIALQEDLVSTEVFFDTHRMIDMENMFLKLYTEITKELQVLINA